MKIPGSVVVHAPHFFPWPPLMARIALAENLIVLDSVSFKKDYFHNRTRLADGARLFWSTLPIAATTRSEPLKNVLLAQNVEHFRAKMKKSIIHCYANQPHFDNFIPDLIEYADNHIVGKGSLTTATLSSIDMFFSWGIAKKPNVFLASELGDCPDDRTRMVAHYAHAVGANVVINGFGASSEVHDLHVLERHGIEMRFTPREIFSAMSPGLSYIHYLFRYGPEFFQEQLELLRSSLDQ